MNLIIRQVQIVLSSLLVSSSLYAQQSALELDATQTQIEFTLGSFLHTVHGTFKLKSGEIRFDPASGKASGMVTLDSTSGETGNKARDRKMHRDVLESSLYPEIAFAPVAVLGTLSPQGESQVELQGVLEIHGARHDLAFPATVRIAGSRLTARMHFVIPYKEWGLKDPSTFMLRVSDKVDVTVQAVGNLRGHR